ncbi:serine protease family S08A [Thraustotheca clavata]|uniref:subtilisin n=1 Tax=Thraustotheca clavata TaxID=74557 RepID=A0A1V9ZNL2_9STRA|nr:serine protease family S08A [Thraustotheca clavata]
MKLFAILAAAAAIAHAKVASSVMRALEVDGRADVFVSFKGSEDILESATVGGRQEVFEILTEHTEKSQKSIEELTKGFETTPLWIVKGTFIKGADQSLVDKLSKNQNIKKIDQLPDIELEPVLHQDANIAAGNSTNQWGIDTIGASNVWKYFKGEGVVIGSVDTGARHTHYLIKDSWRSDRGWYDPYNHTATPEDRNGHGTHTIGTMAGKDGYGVAPGAKWISCRGLYEGSGSSQALLECLQFMICPTRTDGTHPDCSMGAHVINNSWGSKLYNPVYEEAVATIRKAGIIPVFSNGNNGPACATTGNPGIYPNVISVGAIGSYDNEPNKLAYFSSKGPATYVDAHNVKQTITKPTISAPGFYTYSAYNTSDTAVAGLAGTSMAAPHVAGVVALLKSAKIDLTYDEIYAYLTKTADQTMLEGEPDKWYKKDKTVLDGAPNCGGVSDKTFPNNRYGYGRVNVGTILKDGKFADVATPGPKTRTPAPEPVNAKFCTFKKTILSEWNNQLFVDTIKNNDNEGFVIDRVNNIIYSVSAQNADPEHQAGCLSLVKDTSNTNSVVLNKCTGDATQIWKFDPVAKRIIHPATNFCLTSNAAKNGAGPSVAPCSASALSQFFDSCDSVPAPRKYVKLVTKTNKVLSEFYSGIYADWSADNVNEIFAYDDSSKTFQALSNGQCLDAFVNGNSYGLHTYTCDANNGNQKWNIENNKVKHATYNNLCLDVDPTNPVHAAQSAKPPSDGLRILEEAQRKLEDVLSKIEVQIKEAEASYLEDTAHGNIIRGWDGYADLKSKKDILLKKVKPYTDNEKLFSNSSVPPMPKSSVQSTGEAIYVEEKRKHDSKAAVKPTAVSSKHLKLKVKKRKHKDTIGSEEDDITA